MCPSRPLLSVVVTALALLACERRSGGRPAARPADTMVVSVPAPSRTQSPGGSRGSHPELRFADYAVSHTSRGRRPAAVDVASAPYGRMFRTKLREGAAAGPTFAGHYTIVLWGCGTGCQIVAVVDARTGRLSRQ